MPAAAPAGHTTVDWPADITAVRVSGPKGVGWYLAYLNGEWIHRYVTSDRSAKIIAWSCTKLPVPDNVDARKF